MTDTMMPTMEEMHGDAVEIARVMGKPGSLRDWCQWYGLKQRVMESLLLEAERKGVLARRVRQTCGKRYWVWVDPEGEWFKASLRPEELAIWRWVAEQGEVVEVSMYRVSRALDMDISRVWTGARRLVTRGVLKKVRGQRGRRPNVYEVRRFA